VPPRPARWSDAAPRARGGTRPLLFDQRPTRSTVGRGRDGASPDSRQHGVLAAPGRHVSIQRHLRRGDHKTSFGAVSCLHSVLRIPGELRRCRQRKALCLQSEPKGKEPARPRPVRNIRLDDVPAHSFSRRAWPARRSRSRRPALGRRRIPDGHRPADFRTVIRCIAPAESGPFWWTCGNIFCDHMLMPYVFADLRMTTGSSTRSSSTRSPLVVTPYAEARVRAKRAGAPRRARC